MSRPKVLQWKTDPGTSGPLSDAAVMSGCQVVQEVVGVGL
jgi:hypothetical protein